MSEDSDEEESEVSEVEEGKRPDLGVPGSFIKGVPRGNSSPRAATGNLLQPFVPQKAGSGKSFLVGKARKETREKGKEPKEGETPQ